MLSFEAQNLRRQLVFRLLDPMLMVLAMLLCGWWRWESLPPSVLDWVPVIVIAPLGMLVLSFSGSYAALARERYAEWLGPIVSGILFLSGLLFAVAFITKTGGMLSRLVLLSWPLVSLSLLAAARLAFFRYHRSRLARGLDLEPVVLVGSMQLCQMFRQRLERERWFGLRVYGIVSDDAPVIPEYLSEGVMYDRLVNLAVAVERHQTKTVVVCGRPNDQKLMLTVLQELRDFPVLILLAPDLSGVPFFNFRHCQVGTQLTFSLSSSPLEPRAELLKMVEDYVLGSLALLIFAPVMVLVAIAIKMTSRGPVLFTQERHGKFGKVIRVHKFRTMYSQTGADPLISKVEASARSDQLLASALPILPDVQQPAPPAIGEDASAQGSDRESGVFSDAKEYQDDPLETPDDQVAAIERPTTSITSHSRGETSRRYRCTNSGLQIALQPRATRSDYEPQTATGIEKRRCGDSTPDDFV